MARASVRRAVTLARVTPADAPSSTKTWTAAPAPVASAEARALLRDYYVEVSDRWYRLHHDRDSTPAEIEEGLAASPSDDLVSPGGAFLIGRYGGVPAGCAGVRLLGPGTAELKRLYIRPALRGTGGGRVLLSAVEEAARDLGADRIVLDTRLDLVEARALYAAHGYAETSAHNDDPYAEIWYGKRLRARR